MKIFRIIYSIFNVIRQALSLLLLLLIFSLIGAAFSEQRIEVPSSAALVVAPVGFLVEQLEGDPLSRALAEVDGTSVQQTLVKDVTDSLDAAADDERIKAVLLDLNGLEGGGLSKLQAIAGSIDRVREAGKPVLAVGDNFTQAQYFLAAHADDVYLHELGGLFIEGFGYFRTYLKDAIDKLKLDLNVFRVGEYKSFVEPFTRNDMSDEDKHASSRWLDTLWQTYQRDVAQARGLTPESIDTYANDYLTFLEAADGNTAQAALDAGLVDFLAGRQSVRDRLIGLVGESDDDSSEFSHIHFLDYLQDVRNGELSESHSFNVGVLVAAGEIVNGEAAFGTIGGDTMAGLIQQAAGDDSIQALVLRVDSPGGSMFASEVILEQLLELKALGKPLVVSMSTLAASGGYYIAMPADEIWASESTLTGSIGVGALIPTVQRSLNSLGINIDGIGTTQLAGQFRVDRELGPEARQLVQMSVEDAYRIFIGKVADQREMSVERVNNLARGRVWIGADALELGLVDNLGGLDDAIDAAARLAGLADGDYGEVYIERDLTFREMVLLEFSVAARNVVKAIGLDSRRTVLDRIMATVRRELSVLEKLNDPRGLYYHCLCVLP